jgi:hypothetical protein
VLSRLTNKLIAAPAFLEPRRVKTPSQELAEKLRGSGYPIIEPIKLCKLLSPERITCQNPYNTRGQSTRFFCQHIDHQGEADDLNLSFPQAINLENVWPIQRTEPSQLPANKRAEYTLQQRAYIAKIRTTLTPRPLSEDLKEFDSTKDNPPNSHSARFGLKPNSAVYRYRLVS